MNYSISTRVNTQKGATSLDTTCSARIDLFFKLTRDFYRNNSFFETIDKAWNEDPLDTMKILFHGRDCRGGKGDRSSFLHAMVYIAYKHYNWWVVNLRLIPEFGRWNDLFELVVLFNHYSWEPSSMLGADFTRHTDDIITLVVNQLKSDKLNMMRGNPATLLAKWIPSENKKIDKSTGLYMKISKKMYCIQGDNKIDVGRLRKEYISPLREYIDIVERYMCSGRWSEIDFSKVPSVAMHKLKKAFEKNANSVYNSWCEKLQKNEVKVNFSQVYPHQLVASYLHQHIYTFDIVVERQWRLMIERLESVSIFNNSIALCDVSASMAGVPLQVCIAMGIIISSLAKGQLHNKILTFETNPNLVTIPSTCKTLFDKVNFLSEIPWDSETNLYKAFDLLLDKVNNGIISMPSKLYIFSDMQFDSACACDYDLTEYEIFKIKYNIAGYEIPEVIFWNLRSNDTDDFPISFDEKGTALLSGYSPNLLKSLLECDRLTPWQVMKTVIDNPRYDILQIPI